jgi:hypothetical protein
MLQGIGKRGASRLTASHRLRKTGFKEHFMEAQTLSTGSYSEALAYTDSIRESVSVRRPSSIAPTAPTLEAQNKPVILVDTHFRIRSANRLFCERFGISPTISNGALLFRLEVGQWEQRSVRDMLTEVLNAGSKQECTITMDLPGLGHCLVHLTAEWRNNYRPLDLIAVTVEECLLATPPAAGELDSALADADAVRLSRSVMSVSRGLYRELALIIGCAQAVLETADPEAQESAAEIIAAAHQIQTTHSLLLLQARSLSQQVPVELMNEVLHAESVPTPNPDDSLLPLPLCARIAREPMEPVLLKAA